MYTSVQTPSWIKWIKIRFTLLSSTAYCQLIKHLAQQVSICLVVFLLLLLRLIIYIDFIICKIKIWTKCSFSVQCFLHNSHNKRKEKKEKKMNFCCHRFCRDYKNMQSYGTLMLKENHFKHPWARWNVFLLQRIYEWYEG